MTWQISAAEPGVRTDSCLPIYAEPEEGNGDLCSLYHLDGNQPAGHGSGQWLQYSLIQIRVRVWTADRQELAAVPTRRRRCCALWAGVWLAAESRRPMGDTAKS